MPDPCEARDNLLEQMYPISTWGKEFISVLSAQVTYDVFRILASEDETTVNIQGSTKDTYKLNKGQFIEYQKGESTYISSNKPIAVAQYNVGGQCGGNPSRLGDPSMVLLNSIEQIRDTVTLYNSNFQQITENYLNVVALSTDIAKVTLDGTPLVASTIRDCVRTWPATRSRSDSVQATSFVDSRRAASTRPGSVAFWDSVAIASRRSGASLNSPSANRTARSISSAGVSRRKPTPATIMTSSRATG